MAVRNLGVLKMARTPLRVIPETRTIPIDLGDGEIRELTAYPKGPATPVTALIAEDEAYAEWNDATPTTEDREQLTPRRYILRANKAEYQWRKDLLKAAIPDLEEEHANVLVGDDGPWRAILEELDWLAPPAVTQETPADPEAQAQSDDTTGQTDSPDSAPTMTDTTL